MHQRSSWDNRWPFRSVKRNGFMFLEASLLGDHAELLSPASDRGAQRQCQNSRLPHRCQSTQRVRETASMWRRMGRACPQNTSNLSTGTIPSRRKARTILEAAADEVARSTTNNWFQIEAPDTVASAPLGWRKTQRRAGWLQLRPKNRCGIHVTNRCSCPPEGRLEPSDDSVEASVHSFWRGGN